MLPRLPRYGGYRGTRYRGYVNVAYAEAHGDIMLPRPGKLFATEALTLCLLTET